MTTRRIAWGVTGAVIAAVGLGTGLALATSGQSSSTGTTASLTGDPQDPPSWMTSYSGYGAMMNRYGGTAAANGMPGGMMGGSGTYGGTDMGKVMGRVLQGAPGARMSAADVAAAEAAVPDGAVIDAAHDRMTFNSGTVAVTLVAGPGNQEMYRFEAAGMIDPQIVVPAGAHVTLRLVNADTDMAHGIVVTAPGAAGAWMPMMSEAEAFPGAAVWALGEADATSAPAATTEFTATTAGTYMYLCPVPGHLQQGMVGTLTVS